MMAASLRLLAERRKTVFKGRLWCDNGALSVLAASLTPPLMKVIADGYHLLVELEDMGPAFQFCVLYWKKGQESRVSFTLGFWAITESPHTESESIQTLPRACLSVQAPAVRLEDLLGVSVCHIPLHIPVGCSSPHGEACLFFPHFLLCEEESPKEPQLLKETTSQELKVFMLTFFSEHHLVYSNQD